MVKSMCAKFHAKIIIFQELWRGGGIMGPPSVGIPQKPILNRVKEQLVKFVNLLID